MGVGSSRGEPGRQSLEWRAGPPSGHSFVCPGAALPGRGPAGQDSPQPKGPRTPRPAAPTLPWKQARRGRATAEATSRARPRGARQVRLSPARRTGAPPPGRLPHSRLRDPGDGISTPRPGRETNGLSDSRVGGAGAAAAATRRRARAEGASRQGAPTMASKCPKCDKTVYFGESPDSASAPPPFAVRPQRQTRAPSAIPRAPGRRPGMRGPDPPRRAAHAGAARAATPELRSGRRGLGGSVRPPGMRPGRGSVAVLRAVPSEAGWGGAARSRISRPFSVDTWPVRRVAKL